MLRIEPAREPQGPEKIALSMRALSRDPWADAVELPGGDPVQDRVTRLQPFGAFVELVPGLDGLAHISELGAGRRLNHPTRS